MLKVLDLFSGIGGFSLGLEATKGFQTIAFCEIDPFCRKVLAKHWPDVSCFEDITKLGESELHDLGQVDVICGGFPCQDISCAGKGAGIHAARSGLWWEMLRIIRLVRPRYVLVENVAALLNRGLDEVLGSLAESRYDAEWQMLSASSVGAPHRRERVFVVAHARGKYWSGKYIFTKNGGNSDKWWNDSKKWGLDWEFPEMGTKTIPGLPRMWKGCEDQTRVCRMDDGISGGIHLNNRLRGLGNAICPPVAQYVGQCVLDFDNR